MNRAQDQTADREAQMRKKIFCLLDDMEKRRDAFSLMEMNGGRCASRQVSTLRTYNRQQKIVGGGNTGVFV